jgi:hypothetical protein
MAGARINAAAAYSRKLRLGGATSATIAVVFALTQAFRVEPRDE